MPVAESNPIDILKKGVKEAEPPKTAEAPNEPPKPLPKPVQGDLFHASLEDQEAKVRQIVKEVVHKILPEFLARLQNRETESVFESHLKGVLSRSRKGIDELPLGKSARFLAKSGESWQSFFATVLSRGSREQGTRRNAKFFVGALFRGLFKSPSGETGMTVVSDLKFLNEGCLVSDKFARLAVSDPALLSEFEKLSPGDPLVHELLFRGEDLNYTKLVHVAEGAEILNGEAREAFSKQLRSGVNPWAGARLEKSLIEERERRASLYQYQPPRFETGPGKARLWIALSFSVAILLAVLMVGFYF